jgi:hypothetical protein
MIKKLARNSGSSGFNGPRMWPFCLPFSVRLLSRRIVPFHRERSMAWGIGSTTSLIKRGWRVAKLWMKVVGACFVDSGSSSSSVQLFLAIGRPLLHARNERSRGSCNPQKRRSLPLGMERSANRR